LDQLDFGLIGCRAVVPDIDKLTGYIVDEFEELKRAVDQRRSKAEPPREKSQTKREQRAPVRA
jgi:hypothetical protein